MPTLGPPGTRKLLALDGGGIRGILTLEVLASLEALLRERLDAGPDFVLADYFDYMAGTSTGAIIATALSLGMSVADVITFYEESGPAMFDKAMLLRRFRYMYEADRLTEQLKAVVGEDTTLGSDRLRTLLMVVMRNASTDSPWVLTNNPAAKYNDRKRADCNLALPLWQLVRASTAAPVYFPPEVVRIGAHEFLFVDGGVTPYNNPAFQLFLMATLPAHRLQWPTGPDKLLLVSVGTGLSPVGDESLVASDLHLGYNATRLPSALMNAASIQQDTLCRAFGDCRHGGPIDRELGDLRGAPGPWPPQLAYARYNAELTEAWLFDHGLGDIVPEEVAKLDSIAAIPELRRIGRAVGASIDVAHLRGFV